MNDKSISVGELQTLAKCIKELMLLSHGFLLSGDRLWKTLGYPSMQALRQAAHREVVPVKLMKLKHRRQKFLFIYEASLWLAEQRLSKVDLPAQVKSKDLKEIPIEFQKIFLLDHGHLLTQEQLVSIFGFESVDELLAANQKSDLDFPIFRVDGRGRRMFALSVEVLAFAYRYSSPNDNKTVVA